jgi:hypothetical protein
MKLNYFKIVLGVNETEHGSGIWRWWLYGEGKTLREALANLNQSLDTLDNEVPTYFKLTVGVGLSLTSGSSYHTTVRSRNADELLPMLTKKRWMHSLIKKEISVDLKKQLNELNQFKTN